MEEAMRHVSHQQAAQLLHNKFVVVLGDSIQRSVYKDLVLLLQKERFLAVNQLKAKGEMSFEQDCLIEGGCLDRMHNGTEYREVRQYQSNHHLVRFYFVTRIYSCYMQTIMQDFRSGLKPDVVIVNSCLWDITRFNHSWTKGYKENLHQFFNDLSGILPVESLVIWTLTMPVGERIKGGFLVPEVAHRAPQIRFDVVEANFYSRSLANMYGVDVLDLHFEFRFSLHHRIKDGIHWNAVAHRRMTTRLLLHAAQAWGIRMGRPLMSDERITAIHERPARQINYMAPDAGIRQNFRSDSPPFSFMSFDMPPAEFHQRHRYSPPSDYHYRTPRRNPYVMKRSHTRRQFSPYSRHKWSHEDGSYGCHRAYW